MTSKEPDESKRARTWPEFLFFASGWIVATFVASAGLFFDYASSPLSVFIRPSLSYAAMDGPQAEGDFKTTLYGWVRNDGYAVAEKVIVNAMVHGADFDLEVLSHDFKILRKEGGILLFEIDSIPPDSDAVFYATVRIPADHPSVSGYEKLPKSESINLGAPFVSDVHNRFGEAAIAQPARWPTMLPIIGPIN